MARFALAGGHSKKAPGASGYINEYTEDRKVNTQLVSEMKKRGHSVKNCSNEASTVNSELASEVNSANKFKADIFCATHFNAFKKTTGKRGVEVWYYTGDAVGKKIATKMSKDLAKLFGLPNRGAKATTDLYVIAYTTMTAVLPEVCFCDAKGDTNAYKKISTAKIASVMADALELGVGISGGSSVSSGGSSNSGSSSSSGGSSKPSTAKKKLGKVDISYALRKASDGKWWGWVKNFNNSTSEGYAGAPYTKHDALKAKVTKGSIKYRVRNGKTGVWTPWHKNGEAAIVSAWIDLVEMYYTTPSGYEYQQVWYRAQTTERSGWLPVVCDSGDSISGYTDENAGWDGEPVDRLQCCISDHNPY